MDKDKWVHLIRIKYKKFSIDGHSGIVRARDEVSATHDSAGNRQMYQPAHILACQDANF